jgi:hypothetical protein
MAGHTLANSLLSTIPITHRIILIDASAHQYYPIAALRASVVKGWEDKVIVPLTTETVFPKGSQHKVIAPNKVVELRENSVILEKEWEGVTEVPFVVSTPLSFSFVVVVLHGCPSEQTYVSLSRLR